LFVAFAAEDDPRERRVIAVIRANGTGRRVVAVCPKTACEFAWAPKGRQLAVIELIDTESETVAVSLVHRGRQAAAVG